MTSTVIGLVASVVLLLAGPVAAQGQQAGKIYRIGFMPSGGFKPAADAFRQGLKEAGYVEGKNVIIETRFTDGRSERVPEIVAEMLRLKVDVLVVSSAAPALAAKKETTVVPVVFASVIDPVAAGLVSNLSRPEGNITGAALLVGGSGFGGKWVELLKEAVPGLSHVAVLWNPANPAIAPFIREIQAAGRISKVKLDLFDTGNATNLNRAFAAMSAGRAQAIIVTPDPFFNVNRDRLVQFAASKRLPATYFHRVFADAGGLLSYGASLEDSFRRAAKYVDRILKGAKPTDLPVEQPTRFELVVNLRAAKTIGLKIPRSVLLRADHIIE